MSDYPEVVYWLTLINQSGLKLNIVKPIIQRCIAEERPLSSLFALSPLEWATTFGLSDEEGEKATAAHAHLASQAHALTQWRSAGLEPIIRTAPHYPRRLIHTLSPAMQPLLLWARGAIELLNEATITVLGNEAPDEETASFITELMAAAVAENINLVSGYGRGLDRTTFEITLNTDAGRAVVMLPMGLNAFAKTTSKLDAAVAAGRIVLVSPFAPETGYDERLAEARNLLIDHLAMAILALNTDSDAETRAGAALSRGLPVFVSLNDTAGNRALIDQGALLLTDTGEVIEMVQQAVIDAAMLDSTEVEESLPLPTQIPPAPPPLPPTDPNDDYSLRTEEVEPIDSDEALEILSMGGDVPDLLRRRLEKRDQDEAQNEDS